MPKVGDLIRIKSGPFEHLKLGVISQEMDIFSKMFGVTLLNDRKKYLTQEFPITADEMEVLKVWSDFKDFLS